MRPRCPRGCDGAVWLNGFYQRYVGPETNEKEKIQRCLCAPCGLSFSILPPHRLPYRAVRAERLQKDFDRRAGIQAKGLDPPLRKLEEGCLQRAWSALATRVPTLQKAFGQLVCSSVSDVASFWVSLRQAFDSVPKMLRFLSEHHHISLLGNYLCLRPPG